MSASQCRPALTWWIWFEFNYAHIKPLINVVGASMDSFNSPCTEKLFCTATNKMWVYCRLRSFILKGKHLISWQGPRRFLLLLFLLLDSEQWMEDVGVIEGNQTCCQHPFLTDSITSVQLRVRQTKREIFMCNICRIIQKAHNCNNLL